jgi:hypothetical protein
MFVDRWREMHRHMQLPGSQQDARPRPPLLLSEVVDACTTQVAETEAERDRILAAENAMCAAARARFDAAEQHRRTVAAELDAMLDEDRAALNAAIQAVESFRGRVVSEGLATLSIHDAHELLHQLGTPVPMKVLEEEEVDGFTLSTLREVDFQKVFGLNTFGARRRLSNTLRRLANRQGFGTIGALPWSVECVCEWLVSEGLGVHEAVFREQSIDGEVLQTLTRDDFPQLGVEKLGAKARLEAKIEAVKKQHPGEHEGAGAACDDLIGRLSVEVQRRVLEEVLEVNRDLAAQIAAARERSAARAPPPNMFICPITTVVMHDPVMAMDGHTYERDAISAWFQRNDTSPMTRAVITPTLVPCFSLRAEIVKWQQESQQ